MTISSSRGAEMTVDTLVRRAYQLCAVMPTEAGASGGTSDFEFGRAILDTILDSLQAEGVYARSVVFENVQLTAGTATYQLDEDDIDLVGDGMYIAEGEDVDAADTETVVKQIDRETWHRISSKSSEGTPTMMWLNRQPERLELRVWPIPDEDGTIRVQAHQWLADVTQGSVTLELQPFWTQALLWSLGSQLAMAKGLPMTRVSYMEKMASSLTDKAKSYSHQHVENSLVLDHPTPWSNR